MLIVINNPLSHTQSDCFKPRLFIIKTISLGSGSRNRAQSNMGRRRNHTYYKLHSDLGKRSEQITRARIQLETTKTLCERLASFGVTLNNLTARAICGGSCCACRDLTESINEFYQSVNRMKKTVAFCEEISRTEFKPLILHGFELEVLIFLRECRIHIKYLTQIQALTGVRKCKVSTFMNS